MPTSTYTPLATYTYSSAVSTVTFSNINQGFRDLVLVINGVASTADVGIQVRANGDSSANYPYVSMYGDGSTAASGFTTGEQFVMGLTPSLNILNIFDYSATNKHKTALISINSQGSGPYLQRIAARWGNTAAITSLTVTMNNGSSNFYWGTTMNLYGIAA